MVRLQILNDKTAIRFKAVVRQAMNRLQSMLGFKWHVDQNSFEIFMLIVGNGAYMPNKTYGQRCIK